ncbi:MAG TPA: alpha/beta fold hydrolase, partial [Thermoanaerobaculia bacterium]|nr:alpha/beta fold hydrolase [Thermoanaerobaculia bacterium]
RIGRIRTPADVVWGEADGIFPVDVGRRFARELPRARFHLIPGCGHTPQAECPGRFAKLLLWILDEPPPEPTVDVPDEPWRDPVGKPAG